MSLCATLPRIPRLRPLLLLRARAHSTTAAATIDPSEIAHFTALAADWWDPHGSSRLLHLMNPLRLRFLRSCLQRHPRTDSNSNNKLRYLDVGCGGGILAETLARLPTTESVLGIDPTPQVLRVAQEHMRRDPALAGKLSYRGTTIEGVGGDQFDVVTAMEVVEHVPDSAAFLEQCMRHVRPGGWVVGSTIARTWASWVTTKLVAEDLLGIVPRGTHDWNKYVNADELRAFFAGQQGWGAEDAVFMGCVYVPGFGWREVRGGEKVGNYFFGIRRNIEE